MEIGIFSNIISFLSSDSGSTSGSSPANGGSPLTIAWRWRLSPRQQRYGRLFPANGGSSLTIAWRWRLSPRQLRYWWLFPANGGSHHCVALAALPSPAAVLVALPSANGGSTLTIA